MSRELTDKTYCIQMRSGMELWITAEQAERFQDLLQKLTDHKFVEFDGETLNTADVTGVFTGAVLEDLHHLRKGEWRCKWNNWHRKGERCECSYYQRLKEQNDSRKALENPTQNPTGKETARPKKSN